MFCYFRNVIGLGISVGILGIAVIVMGYCMFKRWRKKIKEKLSDENLCKVEYNPTAESVRILEGVDPMQQLYRQVLISRLESGIERCVEDIGFGNNERDMFDFEQSGQSGQNYQSAQSEQSWMSDQTHVKELYDSGEVTYLDCEVLYGH